MFISYWHDGKECHVVEECEPDGELSGRPADDYGTPLDADVLLVIETDDPQELLRETVRASMLAEEDVIGFSAPLDSERFAINGVEEFNRIYVDGLGD